VDQLAEKDKFSQDEAIFSVLRKYIRDTKKVRFEGDGYSQAWVEEAARRGESTNKNTAEALKVKISDKVVSLFEAMQVMNRVEMEARHEVELIDCIKHIQIESRVIGDLARNHIIPTAIQYQNVLVKNVRGLKEIYGDQYKKYAKEQLYILEAVSVHIEEINANITKMIEKRKYADKIEDLEKRSRIYCDEIRPFFDSIRYHCDKLEMLIDDQLWPLAKYRELLFTH